MDHLSKLKRLVTTRPTLQQYIIRRREDQLWPTTKPAYLTSPSLHSPCPNGSTKCILKHLQDRGLIRITTRTPNVHTSHKLELEAKDVNSAGSGRSMHGGTVKPAIKQPTPRGKNRYRPDCWTVQSDDDNAPPIDYSEYSDASEVQSSTASLHRGKRGTLRGNRRSGTENSPIPCLWEEDWQDG